MFGFGKGCNDSLLFFFLLLVIILCKCKLFTSGSELLFFFLLLVILFCGVPSCRPFGVAESE